MQVYDHKIWIRPRYFYPQTNDEFCRVGKHDAVWLDIQVSPNKITYTREQACAILDFIASQKGILNVSITVREDHRHRHHYHFSCTSSVLRSSLLWFRKSWFSSSSSSSSKRRLQQQQQQQQQRQQDSNDFLLVRQISNAIDGYRRGLCGGAGGGGYSTSTSGSQHNEIFQARAAAAARACYNKEKKPGYGYASGFLSLLRARPTAITSVQLDFDRFRAFSSSRKTCHKVGIAIASLPNLVELEIRYFNTTKDVVALTSCQRALQRALVLKQQQRQGKKKLKKLILVHCDVAGVARLLGFMGCEHLHLSPRISHESIRKDALELTEQLKLHPSITILTLDLSNFWSISGTKLKDAVTVLSNYLNQQSSIKSFRLKLNPVSYQDARSMIQTLNAGIQDVHLNLSVSKTNHQIILTEVLMGPSWSRVTHLTTYFENYGRLPVMVDYNLVLELMKRNKNLEYWNLYDLSDRDNTIAATTQHLVNMYCRRNKYTKLFSALDYCTTDFATTLLNVSLELEQQQRQCPRGWEEEEEDQQSLASTQIWYSLLSNWPAFDHQSRRNNNNKNHP